MVTVPTRGETYDKLKFHLIMAQEQAAMMAHLHGTEDTEKDKLMQRAWLAVSDMLRKAVHNITVLAQGKMQ